MTHNNLPVKIKALFPFPELRPAQKKSIEAGLFDRKNILVCTPTGSGKTQVAEFAMLNYFFENLGKTMYVVPLKALASEKFNDFKNKYEKIGLKVGMSIGDLDNEEPYLSNYDVIITTSEKLDSMIRHKLVWIHDVKLLIIDEIHLLNDSTRGPTLEMVITMLRKLIPKMQIIGLSATIGNPSDLADWLNAKLVLDNFRPCPLKEGIYFDGKLEFYD
ncbi:MAG: DEAD/DEAH box helicase [Candidatus Woesearchaeota archaeon]|jgi:helicase